MEKTSIRSKPSGGCTGNQALLHYGNGVKRTSNKEMCAGEAQTERNPLHVARTGSVSNLLENYETLDQKDRLLCCSKLQLSPALGLRLPRRSHRLQAILEHLPFLSLLVRRLGASACGTDLS